MPGTETFTLVNYSYYVSQFHRYGLSMSLPRQFSLYMILSLAGQSISAPPHPSTGIPGAGQASPPVLCSGRKYIINLGIVSIWIVNGM